MNDVSHFVGSSELTLEEVNARLRQTIRELSNFQNGVRETKFCGFPIDYAIDAVFAYEAEQRRNAKTQQKENL